MYQSCTTLPVTGMPTVDEAKAASLFEKACDGEDAYGCAQLVGLYALGKGVPKDEGRALKLGALQREGLAAGAGADPTAAEHGLDEDRTAEIAA